MSILVIILYLNQRIRYMLHYTLKKMKRMCVLLRMRGGELFERIAKHGPMSEDIARRYMKDLLECIKVTSIPSFLLHFS